MRQLPGVDIFISDLEIRISFGFRPSTFGFMNMTPAILIVEDDDLQFEIYEEALARYDLMRAKNGTDALALIPRKPPNLLILDHVLADGELGLHFLPEFKELLPHVPIVVVSGALEVRQQIAALQGPRRAHYCLPKPVDVHDLRRTVETALNECGDAEIIRQFEALERAHRIDSKELFSRSTDRLSRQNRIQRMISDATQPPNISALAREFRVSRRTIIRDLQELIRRGQISPDAYPGAEMDREED
jgi:ActR/RegA family two-component response regulator